MNLSHDLPLSSFDYPSKIERIICSDFDETYLPFGNNKNESGIRELEDFMDDHVNDLSAIIGWVTGSSLESVLNKSRGYISRLPHFIAGSMGTELYMIEDTKISESQKWIERIVNTGFSKEKIGELVELLQIAGIRLYKQIDDYQGKYMECYYYKISENLREDLALIKKAADNFNMKAILTKCSIGAGDPPDCYDLQFVPLCCGKEQILLFLSEQLSVKPENTWAFGDSCNDLEMLNAAGNAFLVGNADPTAKKMFKFTLPENYCYGIKNKLSEMLYTLHLSKGNKK